MDQWWHMPGRENILEDLPWPDGDVEISQWIFLAECATGIGTNCFPCFYRLQKRMSPFSSMY
jgi:hypothetical protein